jgi:hypothetical protein
LPTGSRFVADSEEGEVRAVALDVHRVLCSAGREVVRGRIASSPAAIARLSERLAGREVHIALEACTGWLFVCDALVGAGAPAVGEQLATSIRSRDEAALAACRPSRPDHAQYLALKGRGLSHTRASLTIARKLARRSYHVLRELGPTALEPVATT